MTQHFDDALLAEFNQLFNDNPLSDSPYFIGMMSGTSLDGMDAVLCEFFDEGEQAVNVVASHSLPFPDDLKSALLALTQPDGTKQYIIKHGLGFESELDVFGWASVYYANFASQVVLELLDKANIDAQAVSAIGCHGQTVRHRPQWSFSLQLLDPNVLAERTGIAVVSDFRRRDMAVGGQGAPLVPAFHRAMFQDPAIKAVLNLGGIANITVLGRDGLVQGFDTGVANLLMDAWIHQHQGVGYDKDGNWASSGTVIQPLLTLLLEHPFFAKTPPKSTGREEFHLGWLQDNLNQLGLTHPNLAISPADVQATLAELTAQSAANAIKELVTDGTLIVCGGGALNTHLMTRLQAHLPHLTVQSSAKSGVSPILVEGMAFAWLARQTILGRAGNVPAVTGADKEVVLGQVCF